MAEAAAPMDTSEDGPSTSKHFTRPDVRAKVDTRFLVEKTGHFAVQFAHLYFSRLHGLRPVLLQRANAKWGRRIPILNRITSLQNGKEAVVIGTLYKTMKKKIRVLDEFLDDYDASARPADLDSFVSDDDTVLIEDAEGRLDCADFPAERWVTGVIVALRGTLTDGSKFVVRDVCVPGLAPSIPFPPRLKAYFDGGQKDNSSGAPTQYVALMSGFQLGRADSNPLLFQMMIDYVTGFLGGEEEQELCSRIVRVIVAGNSLVEYHPDIDEMSKKERVKDTPVTEPLTHLDLLLTQLAASVPVDLMCGPTDPTNYSLPQQPFHRCMFPSTSTYESFTAASNPHAVTVDDIAFLGTSGQNVDDINKYMSSDPSASPPSRELEPLENTLKWRVMCPTAPDTLGAHPEVTEDVFLIDKSPHVYFTGNQRRFATKLVEEDGSTVRIVSIPRFFESHTIVLCDLSTLKCEAVTFGAPGA